jgi:hypothetical protein
MHTRKNKKLRKSKKRKTLRRQRGGYTIDISPYMIPFNNDEDMIDDDAILDFKDDFDAFYNDANAYFNKDKSENPMYAANTDINNIIAGLKKICTRHANYISLQSFPIVTPGDILYYQPNSTYRAGHIETILGTAQFSDHSGNLYISRTHPAYGGKTFAEYGMEIDPNEEDHEVHILRYSGPNANLIRATTAFLSKVFLENSMIDYGLWHTIEKIGSKLLTGSTCIEPNINELLRRVNKTKQKLLTHEKVSTVCSGFSILMCELAFRVHDMTSELGKDMPFDAKACVPTSFYSKIQALAKPSEFSSSVPDWQILPFYKQIKRSKFLINEFPKSVLSLLHVNVEYESA